MPESTRDVSEMIAEFDGASLGDARLDERLRRIVALAVVDPTESFPDQMATVADREALYRFLANPKVTMAAVLSGHVQQTHERLRKYAAVRIVHDTTTFRFLGDRQGLGMTRGGGEGVSYACGVGGGGRRDPRALGRAGGAAVHP
ncbi:MAG: IS4/Tn5 family transposase DNA-binding protein [Vicinamibacterales bacterium]